MCCFRSSSASNGSYSTIVWELGEGLSNNKLGTTMIWNAPIVVELSESWTTCSVCLLSSSLAYYGMVP